MPFEDTVLKRENKIINILKRGSQNKTKIYILSGLHLYVVDDLLKSLQKKKLVKSEKVGNKILWSLR